MHGFEALTMYVYVGVILIKQWFITICFAVFIIFLFVCGMREKRQALVGKKWRILTVPLIVYLGCFACARLYAEYQITQDQKYIHSIPLSGLPDHLPETIVVECDYSGSMLIRDVAKLHKFKSAIWVENDKHQMIYDFTEVSQRNYLQEYKQAIPDDALWLKCGRHVSGWPIITANLKSVSGMGEGLYELGYKKDNAFVGFAYGFDQEMPKRPRWPIFMIMPSYQLGWFSGANETLPQEYERKIADFVGDSVDRLSPHIVIDGGME